MNKLIALFALTVILPGVALKCLMALYKQQRMSIFEQSVVGQNGLPIKRLFVKINNSPVRDFDCWMQLFKGEFNLFGSKETPYNQSKAIKLVAKPGITDLTNITVFKVMNDKLSSVMPNTQKTLIEKFNVLGVTLSNITMQSACNAIIESLSNKSQQKRFAFVNADCVNHYYKNEQYKAVLNSNNVVFADGVGIKLAAKLQNININANVNGTDLFPLLCSDLSQTSYSIYLHGAQPHVVKKTVENIKANYPNLKIAGYSDGYTFNDCQEKLLTKINQSNADILLVALGAPRQEIWIDQVLPKLTVTTAIGVGGLFDFYSGEVSRAPKLLRTLQFEWVWRLMMQPTLKSKRYLIGNPLFLIRVLKDFVINSSNHQLTKQIK